MKNKIKILAITVIMAVVVFLIFGCDDDSENGNNNSETLPSDSSKQIKITTSGTFKKGYYAAGIHDENYIAGCADIYSDGTKNEITFSLKTANTDASLTENNWTGSGEYFLQIARFNQTGQLGTDPSTVGADAWVYTNGDSNKSNMVKIYFTNNTITIDISKFAVTANGAGDEDPDNPNPQLPGSVGKNELESKTYDSGLYNISFNTDNSYTFSVNEEIRETGFYSWNTSQKTVILSVEKTNQGFGLVNKSEFKKAYTEHLSSFETINLPPNTTIEQYVDMIFQMIFTLTTYSYVIANDLITYFSIKVTLPDSDTTIAGCAYSEKAASQGLGTHYLLNISFNEALDILTSAYGQPENNWNQQSSSIFTIGNDWVILEYTRFNDFRLTENVSDNKTTKGWRANL